MDLKKNENSFSFFFGSENVQNFDFTAHMKGLTKLSFQLHSEDTLFYNYTELPSENEISLIMCTNPKGSNELAINENISEERQTNQIGTIEIDIENLDLNFPERNELTLNFDVRSAYREYQIIIPEARKIKVSSIKIIGGAQENYLDPEETVLVGSQKAMSIKSQQPIQLQQQLDESPKLELTYTSETQNGIQNLSINLPNPSPENLKILTVDGTKKAYCATSIIYV